LFRLVINSAFINEQKTNFRWEITPVKNRKLDVKYIDKDGGTEEQGEINVFPEGDERGDHMIIRLNLFSFIPSYPSIMLFCRKKKESRFILISYSLFFIKSDFKGLFFKKYIKNGMNIKIMFIPFLIKLTLNYYFQPFGISL